MATQQLVTVQNIKNPAVKRQMTVASARMNSKKWRVISEEQPVEVKKKDVKPAVGKLPEASNSFVSEAHDDLGKFVPPAKILEPSEKETLQAEYETKSGKKPDGRWNEGKLREKIAELNTHDDAAN